MSRPCLAALLACGLAALSSPPVHAEADAPADVAAIRQVVEQFRSSIIHKDRAEFMALFFSEDPARVTWQFVIDDRRLERIRAHKPDALKARYLPQSNHVQFIDAVVASPVRNEEVFSGIRVDTDGEAAAVAFDYAFLEDGAQTNWGRELWQLIRTERGWKIISVVFSVRDPLPAPR